MIQRFAIPIFLTIAILSGDSTMLASSNKAIKITATFPGSVLKCIFSAEKELEIKNIDVERYEVLILDTPDTVILILKEPGLPKDEKGNSGKLPGYEVEVRKSDYRIIRSNFVR
jgi:hypothetical protein